MFKAIKRYVAALKSAWEHFLDEITPADTYDRPYENVDAGWKVAPQQSPELTILIDTTRERCANSAVESLLAADKALKERLEAQARYNAEQFAAPPNERRQH